MNFCPCLGMENSLLPREGNSSRKPAESLAFVAHSKAKSRPKRRNSLYCPCITGMNQRRVRTRLGPYHAHSVSRYDTDDDGFGVGLVLKKRGTRLRARREQRLPSLSAPEERRGKFSLRLD